MNTDTTSQPSPNEAPASLALGSGSESALIAKQIPWRFSSHMSTEKEHALMLFNKELNLACETITKYRNGIPGKARRYFYVNEKKSPIFNTLPALLEAYPLLRELAAALWPPNKHI